MERERLRLEQTLRRLLDKQELLVSRGRWDRLPAVHDAIEAVLERLEHEWRDLPGDAAHPARELLAALEPLAEKISEERNRLGEERATLGRLQSRMRAATHRSRGYRAGSRVLAQA